MNSTTEDRTVLDLFAGPGGWDQGVAPLGIRPRGVEWDTAACETGRAAGHERVQADVAALEPLAFGKVSGLIASPPCQGFSMAGKGRGRDDSAALLELLAPVRTRADLEAALPVIRAWMTDERTALVLEPLRYALALTPSWLAWEQVPAALPVWEACAVILRRLGYTVATGVLRAEQYGVPQTRRRAILVARAPWLSAQLGPAALPVTSHPVPLTIADALPHRAGWELHALRGAGLTERYGTRPGRCSDQPAFTIRAWKDGRMAWRRGWEREAPSTLELATLQTFPADYPWQGAATTIHRQIGDAVPPLLAQHVVAAAAGLALPMVKTITEAVA